MTVRARRTTTTLLTVAVATTLATLPAAATTAATTATTTAPVEDPAFLARAAPGSVAVGRLGDELPEVASLNDMTTRGLENLLLEDRTAWVHPSGRVFFVDPAPATLPATTPAEAPYTYGQTFSLHSKPGSSKTIYLDFDGQDVSGTLWNSDSLPAQTHPAFSLDGDPTTFSATEQDLVQSVWQRVSEDYAPFDVDVTTADPGVEALRRTTSRDTGFGARVLLSPSTAAAAALCSSQCGGIAFINSFADTGSDAYQPTWVFPHLLSNDAKSIAEAVTHEVGHNLGLEHDGYAGGDYFGGHGSWAPIMGSGYNRPIVQWSKGEYATATEAQDDLAVIAGNGLAYVDDDHGDTLGTATTVAAGNRTAAGLISEDTDKDYLAFGQGCAGPVTVSVSPASTSPNLDVQLRLLSPDGTQLAMSNPISGTTSRDVASGMGATAQVTVTSGSTLYAEVDGVGAGDALTSGYSDYASLGRYTITSTGCDLDAPAVVAFQSATQSADEAAGTVQMTVTRTGNTAVAGTVSYARTGGTATPDTDFALTAGTLSFTAGETSKSIPLTIVDDDTDDDDETVEVTLGSPGAATIVGTVGKSTLTITDDDVPPTPAVVAFDQTLLPVGEDTGLVGLTVTRSGNTAVQSTVQYERTGGSTAPADVLLSSGTLTFEPGQTQRTVAVTVVDDDLPEPAETVQLELSSPSDGTLVAADAGATLTIEPSDQQPDAMISTRPARGFVGIDIVNANGAGQTKTVSAPRGQVRSFFVRVVNDEAAANQVSLFADRLGRGAASTYFVDGTDVTALLTSRAGSSVDLGPAQAILVQVNVKLGRKARVGAIRTATVTAAWDGDSVRKDVVKASVKVVRW